MAQHGALATLKDLAEKEVMTLLSYWERCVVAVSRRKSS